MKTTIKTMGCSLAVLAAVLTPVLTPGAAKAASLSLDWDQNDYTGTNSQSFDVGDGSINFNFTGSTDDFVSFGGNKTPNESTTLNGSSSSNKTLHLQFNPDTENESIKMSTAFNGYGSSVQDVSFMLYDIDISGSANQTNNSWNDLITVKGFLNGNEVGTNFSGAGLTSGSVEVSGNSLNGVKPVNNNSDNGNVLVNFAGPIDKFELVFSQDAALVQSNPGSHGIGVGDINFTGSSAGVPEPMTMGGTMLALGLGGYVKKKMAKKA